MIVLPLDDAYCSIGERPEVNRVAVSSVQETVGRTDASESGGGGVLYGRESVLRGRVRIHVQNYGTKTTWADKD